MQYMTEDELPTDKEILENVVNNIGIMRYRFVDDPEYFVRKYICNPTWDEKTQSFCLIPAEFFEGKAIILL